MNVQPSLFRRTKASFAVSTALMLLASHCAHAQQAAATNPPAAAAAAEDATTTDSATPVARPRNTSSPITDPTVSQVLVVGARAAEQSSIQRKKNAPTALDSIVADDVGSFPDRNIAEAISRVSGVTLARDEFGEGSSVSIRGNGPDLTRVEIDGMAVVNAAGSEPNTNAPGRGVMLTELPSDLIASVDVVKGATAAMTEGSLGGAIIVKTRTGLDFKKRTIVFRGSAAMNSLNKKWNPNLNLIFADKYLDGKLGVVFNITAAKYNNESHMLQNTSTPRHLYDFDNSPEKTFSFQPHTMLPVGYSGSTADTPLAAYARTGTTETFKTLTPREVVTRSAGAKTKAECQAAFPFYTNDQLATIATPANRAAAQNQRGQELITCLNQWNDALSSNPRRKITKMDEDRRNFDLRFDYKVNKDLTVYVKHARSRSEKEDNGAFLGQGGDITVGTEGTHYVDTVSTIAAPPYSSVTRAAVPGTNYFLLANSPVNRGVVSNVYRGLANGAVINVNPASVRVDKNHNIVSYDLPDAGYGMDTIFTFQGNKSSYTQAGATYRKGPFKAELLAGKSDSEYYRYGYRSNLYATVGPAHVDVTPSGIITVTPSQELPIMDPTRYSQLTTAPSTAAGTVGQRINQNTRVRHDGNIKYNEMGEKTLKGDFSYSLGDAVPFLNKFDFGFNSRKMESRARGFGATVASATATTPAIFLPNVAINTPLTICQDTAISLAPGGNPCQYGIPPVAVGSRTSARTLTQAEFESYVQQSLMPGSTPFFNGVANAPAGLGNSWPVLDMKKFYALTGVPGLDPRDCLIRCQASDGKYYDQPVYGASEKITSGYLSTDFAFDRVPFTAWKLPFGLELEGNFGYRYVKADIASTTSTTFTAITPIDPNNPDPLGAVVTSSIRKNASFNNKTTDITPILNLAVWAVPDEVVIRYNRAKTIARQPISVIYGAELNCEADFRTALNPALGAGINEEGDPDNTCRGTMGNPAIKPYTNWNQNLSAEWYVDRDTMLSISTFHQKGFIGANRKVRVYNQRPFQGSGLTSPTGQALDGMEFQYDTWENAEATTRTGLELGVKTAFSFLPSVLRNTGGSANFTKLRSKVIAGSMYDPYSGEALPPSGESDYSWNASLWYDDGALNMRVAMAVVKPAYLYMSGNAVNYPMVGVGGQALPYDPAMPVWRDATRYVDAKIGYKFKNGIEVFAEGRNLGRRAEANGPTTSVLENGSAPPLIYRYGGASYLVGAVVRY